MDLESEFRIDPKWDFADKYSCENANGRVCGERESVRRSLLWPALTFEIVCFHSGIQLESPLMAFIAEVATGQDQAPR